MTGNLLVLEIKGNFLYPGFIRQEEEILDSRVSSDDVNWVLTALVLNDTLRGPVPTHAVSLDMAPLHCGENNEPDVSPLDDALDALASEVDLGSCTRAVLVLPASLAACRHLDLPFRAPGKIRQVLSLELAALLPLAEEPHFNDFCVAAPGPANDHTLLTASIPCSLVNSLIQPLEKWKIQPVSVSICGYSAALLLLDIRALEGFCIVLDVQPLQVVITGVLAGKPISLRSIDRQIGNAGIPAELQRTCMGIQGRFGLDTPLDACHVIWSDDRDKTLEAQLEKELAVPVIHETFSARLTSLEPLTASSPHPVHAYMNAFAAAHCYRRRMGFNFFSEGQDGFFLGGVWSRQLMTVALLLFLCFCLGMAGEYMKIHALKTEAAVIDQQAADIFKDTFPEVSTLVDPYMQMTVKVREATQQADRRSASGNRGGEGPSTVSLLSELAKGIPGTVDVTITRLIRNEDRMVLSGNTDNYNSVDKMQSAIESSPLFRDVKISNASADKKDNRIRFKFIFQVAAGEGGS